MITKKQTGWATAVALLVAAGPAHASDLQCQVHQKAEGIQVQVQIQGSEVTLSPPEAAWSAGDLACEPWEQRGVRVVLPAQQGRAYEAFVAVTKGQGPVVAWEGRTGLSGDYGERWGWFLDYAPMTPDGDDLVPILYVLHEQVKLCGYGMVPLWVRMLDASSGTFRPITFDRLRRSTLGWGHGSATSVAGPVSTTTKIVSSVTTSKDIPDPPVLEGFLRFRSASSTLGDGADPTLIRAPLELGDSDPQSGWMEGVGGNGWGEFVTATTADSRIPITMLALHLTRGESKAEIQKLNRPRKLTLVTSGGQIFDVKIPVDPGKHAGAPVLVRLPSPVATECVSVILRDVFPAKAKYGDHTYIGEVTAYTALDSGDGILDLMEWFDDPDRRGAVQSLMQDVSATALKTIAGSWQDLSPRAREGVLSAIHQGWGPVMEDLAQAAADSAQEQQQPAQFELLVDGLTRLLLEGDVDLANQIGGWMDAPSSPALREAAAASLARTGHAGGLGTLVEALVPGEAQGAVLLTWAPLTEWIREGLKLGGEEGLAKVGDALDSLDLEREDHVRAALTLLYILDHEGGGEGVQDLCAHWCAKLWQEVPTLWCRHHILPLAGKLISLEDPRGVQIASAALTEPGVQPPLRMEALAVLGTASGDLTQMATPPALASLTDENPGVRAQAADSLRHMGALEPQVLEEALLASSEDLWPEVRLSSLKLVDAFDDVPVEAFHDFLVDPDSDVRKQAIRMAVKRGFATEEIGILLANTTIDAALRGDVRVEAAHAIGSLCLVDLAMPLGNVLYYGIVPGASEAQIQTAAAAADALGRLGDPGPLDKLVMAMRPGLRLQIRLAAIHAAALIADPAALDPLKELTKSPDKTIAAAAADAVALIQEGETTSACVAKP